MSNIRHDINPLLVKQQINKAIARHEELRVEYKKREEQLLRDYKKAQENGSANRWTRVPEGSKYVDPMIDKRINVETNHYALVRVIEMPTTEDRRYILVYGDEDDQTVSDGTGPFLSYSEAVAWFMDGGR